MINAKILSKGFAELKEERDDISIHIKTLRMAQEEAMNKKRGMYNKKREKKSVTYTDYTDKENTHKASNFFDFIKKEGDILGVVELVISGSKYKLRLDKFNCYVMVKL